MKPALGVPTPDQRIFSENEFRYVPGALTIPKIETARDDFAHRAAVWRVNQAVEDCSPSGKLYRLSDLFALPRLPVYVEYVLDSRNLFVPHIDNSRRAAKVDLRLRDTDLRFVRRIRIEITNVTAYSAGDAMLQSALRDIAAPRRCRFAFVRRAGVVQVDGILAGDVKIEVDFVEGASVKVADVIRAKVFKSVSRHILGKSVFFAVSSRPVPRI